MAKILIVGSGDVGGGLARDLAADNHDVWGMRRSETPVGGGVQTISVDVSDMETLIGKVPEKLDYLVYCVASPDFTEEGYDKFYVTGMKNIIALLKQMHEAPKRVFFVSSTSVYPHHDGSWVDEDVQAEPTAFTGKKMLEAEQLLHRSGFANTVVRFSGIYGPGRTRLINQAQGGGHCDPEPDAWTNRIHRDDCIGSLKFLINQDLSGTQLDDLYLGTDPTPAPLFEILEWLKDRITDVEPDHDVPNVSRRGSKRCSSKRLIALGYQFQYESYKQGYEEVLVAMEALDK